MDTRKCPACSVPMHTFNKHRAGQDIEIDICSNCQGSWFDVGEFASSVGRDGKDLFQQVIRLKPKLVVGVLQKRVCPCCDKPLEAFQFSRDLKLIIDGCYDCGGVFLDRGEGAIIERSLRRGVKLKKLEKDSKKPAQTGGNLSQEPDEERWWFQLIIGLPLEHNVRPNNFSLVNHILIASNVIIFLVVLGSIGVFEATALYGLTPANIVGLEQSIQFLTSMFLHGGFLHLLGNMYFLYLMGDNVEDWLGHWRYILFYLVCGFMASAVFALCNSSSGIPAVGASGAISGVIAAYLIACPRAKIIEMVLYTQFKIPVKLYVLYWFLLQWVGLLFELQQIAWEAHLGGFFTGLLLFPFLRNSRARSLEG